MEGEMVVDNQGQGQGQDRSVGWVQTQGGGGVRKGPRLDAELPYTLIG